MTTSCLSCGIERDINDNSACQCGATQKRVVIAFEENIVMSDGTEPMPSTVEAKLLGIKIDTATVVQNVLLAQTSDGIELTTNVATGIGKEYLEAEEQIQQICDAISISHHIITEPIIDRSDFPSQTLSAFVAQGPEITASEIISVHTSVQSRLHLVPIIRVLQRADQSVIWVDRLILQWMAFNTLYSDPSISGEQTQIDTFMTREGFVAVEVKPWVDSMIAEKGFNALMASSLTLRGNAHANPVNELITAISNLGTAQENYLDVCRAMLLTVYALRNELFHGSRPALATGITEPLISAASQCLDFILRATLQKRLSVAVTGPKTKFIQSVTVRIGR